MKSTVASYLFDVFFGAAVDIPTRATLPEQARGDITQGDKAGIAIATANNNLVTFAGGAGSSDGRRDGRGSKS